MTKGTWGGGVLQGNLIASGVLMLILFISIVAVIATVIIPLRSVARECPLPLAVTGSMYFSFIGMGFMLTEIALLQRFSVYLGHPIYSLSVCLFSLILASGLGSMVSDRFKLNSRGRLIAWGSIVVLYLVAMEQLLPTLFQHTTGQEAAYWLLAVGSRAAGVAMTAVLLAGCWLLAAAY